MLIQLNNGVPTGNPVTNENFLLLFPDVSFPKYLTPEDVEPFGYGLYEFSAAPTPSRYEKVVETTPVKNATDVWMQSWALQEMSDQEKAEADYKQGELVRADRNRRLAECDWTQLPDAPVDHAVWAAYRQELRDVTGQSGFPWDVQWPTQPGSN